MTIRSVSLRHLLFLGAVVAVPSAAGAQTQKPVPVSPKLPPGLTLSGGVGTATAGPSGFGITSGQRSPYVSASVEVALSRFLLAQGEVLTWTEKSAGITPGRVLTGSPIVGYTGDSHFSRQRREIAFMGNFLGRIGKGRYFGTLGIGFGISRASHNDTTEIVGCVPRSQIDCTQTLFRRRDSSHGYTGQLLAGLDVVLTPKLTAYMSLRNLASIDGQTVATGGLRWTVQRAPVSTGWSRAPKAPAELSPAARGQGVQISSSAIGKDVHVEAYDHSRRNGRLVSLTSTHVTIRRRGSDVTIPLSEVRGIRRQTHAILRGSLFGFGGGFMAGILLCANNCYGDDETMMGVSMMLGMLGLGGGAAVGAVYNLQTADRRIVYVGKPNPTLTLTPIISKGTFGAGGRIKW